MNYLYGGGFYTLKYVKVYKEEDRMSPEGAAYQDISILVEAIDRVDEMGKIRQINELPIEKRKEDLLLDDIVESVNGIGRIVQYRVFGNEFNAQNCAIEFVQEGEFKKASMDGYCRMFDGRNEGEAQLGFFREGVPKGKYQRFSIDGEVIETGERDGETLTTKFDMANFLTRTLKGENDEMQKVRKSIKEKIKK